MKLQEYQSKILFTMYGIPVPNGRIAESISEVKQISEELGGMVVIKAQVLTGGRGKAGGVRIAKTISEAEEYAGQILGNKINGLLVRKVLVDEIVSIDKEIYLSIANDRNTQKPVLMASSFGGMEIEEVSRNNPERIIKRVIDPLLGLRDYQLRDVAINIDLDRSYWQDFSNIINQLWKVYVDSDASLVEINPLVITSEKKLIALDAKIVLDDNALFRHPNLSDFRDKNAEPPTEIQGRKIGVSFIKMEGNIGCLVNGAGLAMATMDIIKELGGEAANFLDIGGGANAKKVEDSLRLILSDEKVKAILINVFGGITRCDEVARGILSAFKELQTKIPVVVRLVGTNDEEGLHLLEGSELIPAKSLHEAAAIAVRKAAEVAA
ncbi:MAG: ADP-forming succinate--CoA ligase subunit beta [Chloroflexi bacterium HGW-Chloroflexi-4]|jgi:succinyl-CoA synthetase beta subunit|nr:MAG: ADP-forming succinate--CoA ligase subunit beta [Chloroflexi bacterium HGW-Chloroflexi-4]